MILGLLALIGVTGLTTEAARIALAGQARLRDLVVRRLPAVLSGPRERRRDRPISPPGSYISPPFSSFLVVVPATKLRHMVTSPANMFLSPRTRPKGAMREMPNLAEVEDIETIGASVVSDFTWKQLFDTEACTICGRCTSVCPANITGKPLDPREIVLKVGEVAAAAAGVAPPVSLAEGIVIEGDSVLQRIRPEEVWSCTTCRACDDICPVNIEILDRILDIRRYLTMMESSFPAELSKAFVGMENQGNPWGLSRERRAAWTDQLDFEVPVFGESTQHAEYLWFVGCAGSYDDRNTAVSQALARLLHQAGIDFAILGSRESCNGDPARRAGQRVLVAAAGPLEHRDPRQARGQEDHHAMPALLQHTEERISPARWELSGRAPLPASGPAPSRWGGHGTGRSGAPHGHLSRPVLPGPSQRHLPRPPGGGLSRRRTSSWSRCHGTAPAAFAAVPAAPASGWRSTPARRSTSNGPKRLCGPGASEIAVSCPYCYVMIDDGIKELGRGDDVKVRDLAQMLVAPDA